MQEQPFPRPRRFRSLRTVVALTALLVSVRAGGQAAEIARPQPNVLLLVDTSGSMEFQTDGTLPTCTEGESAEENDKSRWIELVEVLTGSFENYSCWAQDRSSTDFRDEFTLSSVEPYDFGYGNPFHRALSGNCLYGPGQPSSSAAPFEWLNDSINTFPLVAGAVDRGTPGCAYNQLDNGLLDIFKSQVRFGLMTFDTRINSGTGLSGTSANIADGVAGTWSYFLDEPVTGHPANCSFDLPQEIGARNAAAPVWEGRMVSFGGPSSTESAQRNEWIQEVLLSTRPYGATPIAGLLQDAQDFLWNDTSIDPLDSSASPREFGPTNDPSWRASNCRKSLIVLLTDGEPNLDLRPSCTEDKGLPTEGRCPYDEPEAIVRELRLSPPVASLAVETYVIGFALGDVKPDGSGTAIPCDELTDLQCTNNVNPDDPETKGIQACCTLNEIAAAGSEDGNGIGRKAYFANDDQELREIFSEILNDVVQVATRTQPVFGGRGGDTSTQGFKFFSAFNPNPDPSGPAQLWRGVLERTRFQCTNEANGLLPEEAGPEANNGDDFARNLGAALGTDRHFHSFVGTGDNRGSVRPYLVGDPDELGVSTGTAITSTGPVSFVGQITPAAMDITDATCTGLTAIACSNLILRHAVGITSEDSLVGRCLAPEECHLLGGIYHSTPTIVPGKPAALLRDNSYRAFGTKMAEIARPSTLYTSTVDGFLHAFEVAPFPGSVAADTNRIDSLENNELWAFVPPAVLPALQTQYPSTPVNLLDGLPIIQDVVARKVDNDILLERSQEDALTGAGLWRTVMVQGFGVGPTNGYFAVDITDPRQADGAPKFLWQLTRDSAGNELFGAGGTPLITTVFLGDTTDPGLEIPVAVLPGGSAELTGPEGSLGVAMTTDPEEFAIEAPPRAYAGRETARSLTIVRLDTGEVLRTFRPVSSTAPFASAVFTATDIPAPIVGQPVAFPSGAGAIAERIFVGDADGRMYRLDVSSKNSDDWSMKVFFDAYWDAADDADIALRQPVELPPVLSVNESAELTIAFATGDQEAITADSSMLNRVVSLTEKLNAEENTFISHVNWVHDLVGGARVTGPMVLFNKGLYYAASRPPDTDSASCDRGDAEVFGVHYELDEATQDDPAATPTRDKPGVAPGGATINFSGQREGLIFGVSLESQPSCSSEAEVISGDEGFGYGEVRMSTQTNPGKFFLSYEASGNSASTNGVSQFQTELATPQRPVTFESFALIYE